VALVVLTLAVSLITLMVYLFGYVAKPPASVDFISNYMGNINGIVFAVAAFIGGDALTQDLSSKTAYAIIPLPVRRRTIVVGRFAAALPIAVAVEGIYYLAGAFGALLLYESIPSSLLISFLVSILVVAAVLGISFLFGSVFESGSTAIAATVLLIFVGFFGIQTVLEQANIEPWFLLTYGASLLNSVLPSVYPPHHLVQPVQIGGFTITYRPYPWEGVGIIVGYLFIALLGTFLVFSRREIK